jgi:hypothetical protein
MSVVHVSEAYIRNDLIMYLMYDFAKSANYIFVHTCTFYSL